MGQIRVDVGGRSYPLACKDGEEATLGQLAAVVDAKAKRLSEQLGHLPEARLLLMSAIMLADDYAELKGGAVPAAPADSGSDEAAQLVLDAAERVERVVAALEG
ncbi:MAG: cell division protein ZapA [Pacificimonas sp.]